jgi:hypothetical protein
MEKWHLEIVDIFHKSNFQFACIVNGVKQNLSHEKFIDIIKSKDFSYGYNFIFSKNI